MTNVIELPAQDKEYFSYVTQDGEPIGVRGAGNQISVERFPQDKKWTAYIDGGHAEFESVESLHSFLIATLAFTGYDFDTL